MIIELLDMSQDAKKVSGPKDMMRRERYFEKDNSQYDVPLPGQLSNKMPWSARGSPMRERRACKRWIAEFIPPFENICKSILGCTWLDEHMERWT